MVMDRSLAFAIDPPQRETAVANDVVVVLPLRNAGTLPGVRAKTAALRKQKADGRFMLEGLRSAGHRFHFDLPEVSKAVDDPLRS